MAVKVSGQNSHCDEGRLRGAKALERQTTKGVVTEQKTVEQNRYCIFDDFYINTKSCVQTEAFAVGPSRNVENLYRFITYLLTPWCRVLIE